jgi:hypothetical protein
MGNQVSLILKEIESLQIWDQVAHGVEILNDSKSYIPT